MKLIIAGGRAYQFTPADRAELDAIRHLVTEVVSGAAPGADECGEAWARSHQIPVRRFRANWGKLGPAAGPLRNADMAEYADAVALFPGGKGTTSMRRCAISRKLKIYEMGII